MFVLKVHGRHFNTKIGIGLSQCFTVLSLLHDTIVFRNISLIGSIVIILVTTTLIFIVCLSDIIIMTRLFEVTAIFPRVLTGRQD